MVVNYLEQIESKEKGPPINVQGNRMMKSLFSAT